jgi:GAF domain-containing protein
MQAPLKSRGNLIGRVVVWSEDKNAYAQQELGLLQQAAAQIAPAIENVRHYATLERAVRDRQLLAEIGRVMGSSLDIDDVYTEFASLVRMLIPFDRIAISRINARNGTVVDSYQEGVLLPDRPLHLVRPLAGTPAEDLLRMGKSMMLDLRVDDSPIIGYTQKKVRMTGAGLWSCISVLLTTRNNVVATMDLSSRRKGAYSLRDLEIAERIAAQVAGAIANSSAYEQIARDRRTTMDGRFAVQRFAYITEAAATNPAGASAP